MADTSYWQTITTCVANNKEWIFSGCGVTAILLLGGSLFRRKQSPGQSAVAKKGIVFQAGRDIKIGGENGSQK